METNMTIEATTPVETVAETLVVITVKEIRDPAAIGRYTAAVAPQVARHGGRNLAQGYEVFEGEADARLVVVQAWPSAQAFRDWQADPDYAPWLALRRKAATISMVIVQPVPVAA
jgi:uncharacterized protein (DUF1330 family)